MNQSTLTERITRSLAYMLRHQPEEFDLELDSHGYAEIGDVVCALNERLGEPIEESDLREAITSGDRPRYAIKDESIGALYGHSFPIDPGEPSDPPELLYVGVGSRDADRADRHGLKGGRRAFLHLGLAEEDARETGRRIAPEYTVITVRAKEASEDGIAFYDRQALFLCESIPTEYIEVGEIHTDGVLRERRGGRSGGGGRDRGSRGGGDRDRGRGRGRDRDDRGDRGGRGGRDDSRDRDERPREQAAPAAQRQPEAPMPNKELRPQRSAPSFGLGVGDEAPKRRSERAPEPARRSDPTPEPEPAPSPPKDTGPGFGAGL